MPRIRIFVLTACLLLGAGLAQAASDAHIELATVAEIEIEVVNDQGEKEIQRVEAAKVVPGDEVIYTIHYVNVGSEPAEGVAITNPVPEHMKLNEVSEAAANVQIAMSVDDGQRYDAPENLTVVQADGSQRPAELADTTHIRWTFTRPVQPGDKGYVSFRAQLL